MNTKIFAVSEKNTRIFIFSITLIVATLFFFCNVKNSRASVCSDNCIKEYCTSTSIGTASNAACDNKYGPCVTACAREADTNSSGNTSLGGSTCGNACKIKWQDNCKADSSTCDKNYSDCLAVCYKNNESSASPSTSDASTESVKITKDIVVEGKIVKAGSIVHSDGSVTGTSASVSPVNYNLAKQKAIAANVTNTEDGLPDGGTGDGSYISPQDCGENFEPIGGVCFPITNLPNPDGPNGGIFEILSNLLSWLLGIFGLFAVMAFVISGIQYLTSAGDQDMLERAKRNAQYSLLGVVVGLSGFVIIKAIEAALSAQNFF